MATDKVRPLQGRRILSMLSVGDASLCPRLLTFCPLGKSKVFRIAKRRSRASYRRWSNASERFVSVRNVQISERRSHVWLLPAGGSSTPPHSKAAAENLDTLHLRGFGYGNSRNPETGDRFRGSRSVALFKRWKGTVTLSPASLARQIPTNRALAMTGFGRR